MSETQRSKALKPIGLAGSTLGDQYSSDYDYANYYNLQPTAVEKQNIDKLGVDGAYDFSGLRSNNDLTNEGWGDKFSRWFTPNEKGTSLGGEVMSGIGTGVNVASGLAGMYFQNKQAGLVKDKANMEKDAYKRQVRADQENEARLQRLAKNVGNDAFYK